MSRGNAPASLGRHRPLAVAGRMFTASRARRGGGSSRDVATCAGRPDGAALGDHELRSGGTGDALEVAGLGVAADRNAGGHLASADGATDSSAGADPCGASAHQSDLRSDTLDIIRTQHRHLKVAAN